MSIHIVLGDRETINDARGTCVYNGGNIIKVLPNQLYVLALACIMATLIRIAPH